MQGDAGRCREVQGDARAVRDIGNRERAPEHSRTGLTRLGTRGRRDWLALTGPDWLALSGPE